MISRPAEQACPWPAGNDQTESSRVNRRLARHGRVPNPRLKFTYGASNSRRSLLPGERTSFYAAIRRRKAAAAHGLLVAGCGRMNRPLSGSPTLNGQLSAAPIGSGRGSGRPGAVLSPRDRCASKQTCMLDSTAPTSMLTSGSSTQFTSSAHSDIDCGMASPSILMRSAE